MPSLYEIATYARMFRRLRGRRPTVRETLRYFDAGSQVVAGEPVTRTIRRKRLSRPATQPRLLPDF